MTARLVTSQPFSRSDVDFEHRLAHWIGDGVKKDFYLADRSEPYSMVWIVVQLDGHLMPNAVWEREMIRFVIPPSAGSVIEVYPVRII